MMFRVVEDFCDLMDNGRLCKAGEVYPRPGFSVSDARLAELAGMDNRIGHALIKAVDPPKQAAEDKPKETIKRTPRMAKKAVSDRKKG